MQPFYRRAMCLPCEGSFAHENLFRVNFSVLFTDSPLRLVDNYVYDENDCGHGMCFTGAQGLPLPAHATSKAIAEALVKALPPHRITPGVHTHCTNNYSQTETRGHYLLLEHRRPSPRPYNREEDGYRLAIIFVNSYGGVYQHYRSNVLPTNAEVEAEFAELCAKAPQPAAA